MILMMLIMMMISINRFDHIAAACLDGVSATVFVVSLTDRFGSRLFLPSPTYMPQRGVGRGSGWVCQDLTEAITDHRHRVSDSPTNIFPLFALLTRILRADLPASRAIAQDEIDAFSKQVGVPGGRCAANWPGSLSAILQL